MVLLNVVKKGGVAVDTTSRSKLETGQPVITMMVTGCSRPVRCQGEQHHYQDKVSRPKDFALQYLAGKSE
jgi:hypothetical protein